MADSAIEDPMVAAFVAAMQGPAQACEEAALDILFPRRRRGSSMKSEITHRDGAVVVTLIGPVTAPVEHGGD